MKTLAIRAESFLVVFLWLGGLFLSLYSFVTSQGLPGILGIILLVIAFKCTLSLWAIHPETRNDPSYNSLYNTPVHLSRAFYDWESLPR